MPGSLILTLSSNQVAETETDLIDAQSTALDSIKSGLVHEVESRIATIHRRRNCLVPFSAFPNEVIDAIFMAYFDENTPATIKSLWTLAKVSVTWWQRILATPSLWTYLNVEHSVNAIGIHLRRSKGVPFSFILPMGNGMTRRSAYKAKAWFHGLNDIPALLNPVIAQSHRWRDVNITGPYYRNSDDSLRLALVNPLPRLETLRLSSLRFTPTTLTVSIGGGPNLRKVEILSVPHPLELVGDGFRYITELKLSVVGFALGDDAIWPILEPIAHQLESLHLDRIGRTHAQLLSYTEDEPVHLPRLHTLVLLRTQLVYPCLRRFRTPNLFKLSCLMDCLRTNEPPPTVASRERALFLALLDPHHEDSPLAVIYRRFTRLDLHVDLNDPHQFAGMHLAAGQAPDPGPTRHVVFNVVDHPGSPRMALRGSIWREIFSLIAPLSIGKVTNLPVALKITVIGTGGHEIITRLPHMTSMEYFCTVPSFSALECLWENPTDTEFTREELATIILMGSAQANPNGPNWETVASTVQRLLQRRQECRSRSPAVFENLAIKWANHTFNQETGTFVLNEPQPQLQLQQVQHVQAAIQVGGEMNLQLIPAAINFGPPMPGAPVDFGMAFEDIPLFDDDD